MATNIAKSGRFKRLESKKSHSWWWDSHISPKNSKWLHENLEEMDVHIKRMLKLIEEDADSFAKKAEMYYQKRPELTSLVEEFYRMYRALAERYDQVTGELRKNIPSDLRSQGSGISDVGSEPPSTMLSPERRPIHCKKLGPRAVGFDVFLGSGGSDLNSKDDGESSTLDSESDLSDDLSVNNYSGNDGDQGLRRRINELEVELKEVKEKLRVREDEVSEGSRRPSDDENFELRDKIASYEEELRVAKEKIQASQEEITELTIELQKYKALGESDALPLDEVKHPAIELQGSIDLEGEVLNKTEEELRIAQETLKESENRVGSLKEELTSKDSIIENLQDQLKSAQKEVSMWKNKLEKEKREVSKLQDRMARYKTSLSERDQEIRGLKEGINNANKSLSEENENLKADSTRLLKERAYLEDNIKETDLRRQSLEEEVRRVISGKAEVEAVFGAEIDQLKADIAEKNEAIKESMNNLLGEVSLKNDEIDEMSKHLHELHVEHVELIAGAEGARKFADELVFKVVELEREVERKERVIIEGREEKREAIRQLCFSIEHYRNGYDRLRQAVTGHRRLPVTAS